MEQSKKFVLAHFEKLLIVIILIAAFVGTYFVKEKFIILNFYYLPVLTAGYFLGRRMVVLAAVFSILSVFICILALLPAYRNDLRGWKSQPLSIQYAGDLQLLQSMLTQHGWKHPVQADSINWLQWLDESIKPQRQPLLPQLHDGRTETLLLFSQDYLKPRLLTLRLWDSGIRLQPNNATLWIGNVAYLAVPAGASLHLPRVQPNFEEAFADFAPEVKSLPHRIVPADEKRAATMLIEGLNLE